MIRTVYPLIALAATLASAGVVETAERRSLASTNFAYSYTPGYCATSDTACQQGKVVVDLGAQAETGNSYTTILTISNTEPFPSNFNNKEFCDSGGIICWTGTASSDTTGQVCVHYANDYNCATFQIGLVNKGSGCSEGVTIFAST
ncbi:hypothetical protein B0H13DRAFT_2387761 [Mycena leptocephala]|nr:hypothetical protein B0H13DRAFT_2387761 [Mycena leptocephala]